MGPPPLRYPEWFLRNLVDPETMERLGERIAWFYDELLIEVVYRAHHNSFKVAFADTYFDDFKDYVVRACGLNRRTLWRHLPAESTIRHMYYRRQRFLRYLKKPREKRRHDMVGDIKWSLDFWLSQLSFWYATVKSFYQVWHRVVKENYTIPREVAWDEAITLYIIDDFRIAARDTSFRVVKKKWRGKWKQYVKMEKKTLQSLL